MTLLDFRMTPERLGPIPFVKGSDTSPTRKHGEVGQRSKKPPACAGG